MADFTSRSEISSRIANVESIKILVIFETIATLPGGWDLAHAIRLGIKPFAELGANSEALSGSQVDSPCSCRAIFESAPGNDATVSYFPEYIIRLLCAARRLKKSMFVTPLSTLLSSRLSCRPESLIT